MIEKLTFVLAISIAWIAPFALSAQKMVFHNFQFKADTAQEGTLKQVTHISYSGAASVRMYFEDVRLGNDSYLLLEGEHGAQQKLNAQALKNWRNSSAYFNGGQVKVSVYQAPGEPPVSFKVTQLKVNDTQSSRTSAQVLQGGQMNTQHATTGTSQINLEGMPHGAAIGRLTNGTQVGGAGWISPNGAIVTSRQGYKLISEEGFDIIEFNVPLSNQDLSVNHPAPEDQYPLQVDDAVFTSRDVYVKRVYWSATSPHYLLTHLGFAIIEALPNSTGLTPGERQQEYFLIATNPGSFTVESTDVAVDIFSYTGLFDIYPEAPYSYNFALQKRPSVLLEVKDHVEKSTPDKDELLIYNLYGQNVHWGDVEWSHTGGPVTYQNSNVAIGVHEEANWDLGPSIGNGFSDDNFRTSLNDFFTSNGVYVDATGLYGDEATGEIHKPYIQITDGVSDAPTNAIVYIAKGNYNESVTINAPMTLKAPVGVVKIGSSEGNSARMAEFPLPTERTEEFAESIFDEQDDDKLTEGILSYPNPFTDRTEIQYDLPENTTVSVKVFDSHGNEITTLAQGPQEAGEQTLAWDGLNAQGQPVVKGMYIIKIHNGRLVKSVRVVKK